MKNIFLVSLMRFFVLLIILILFYIVVHKHHVPQTKADTVYVQEVISDWELFKIALIWQESKGDSEAVNGDAVGILQITPIYVAEVNRISKNDTFVLSDRESVSESLKMFEIVQGFHNPEKDIKKAIKLHNPTAGDWYYNSIINYFNLLKYNQK